MCYSAPVSFITFILGILIAYHLYLRNRGSDRWIAFFIISFIIMQFLEGIMWLYKDNGLSVPRFMSYLVLLTLAIQPLVQIGGLLNSNNNLDKNWEKIFRIGFGLILILTFINLFQLIPKSILVGKCGHLDWNLSFQNIDLWDLFLIIYFIFMGLPLLFMKPFNRGLILLSFGILSAILIGSIYGRKEFSSMWCFVAIIYGLLAFLT